MGTNSGAKNLMEALIANNKSILENNLLCSRVITILNSRNVSIPIEYKKNLYGLQGRLTARNEKILTSPFIDTKQTAAPAAFNKYQPDLNSFMNSPGIGVVPVVAAIVVYVVVPILVSAIIYLIFSNLHKESKTDVVYSKELTNTLISKLTPDEYQQLLAENEANAKKIDDNASGASLLKTAKYLAIGFIGFTVIDKFISKRNQK